MTDRQGNREPGGRKRLPRYLWGMGLAVLMILTPAGCGPEQETGQGEMQPEKIGSVGHRDRAEEEVPEESADQASGDREKEKSGDREEENSGSVEDGTDGQEDILHLGRIPASEEEEEQAELTFRIAGEAEDLPQKVQDQIARINKGEQLWKVIGSDNLKDYYALTGTHTVEARERDSGQEAVGTGRLTMYVPNLLEGLTDIAVLFYDNAAGKWCLIPAEKVDMEKRTVSMILTGSGTLTVVHRTQGETEE